MGLQGGVKWRDLRTAVPGDVSARLSDTVG